MPQVRKLRLCNNKSALEQRAEEEELSLAHLRQYTKRQSSQYHEPATIVRNKGLEIADEVGIAKTINELAASLKELGESDCDFDMAALQKTLQKASKTIQSLKHAPPATGSSAVPSKYVTFYDGNALPKSPTKSSNVQTPRRSNVTSVSEVVMGCSSPQRLLHTASTAALSCSSGYLATIGEISPPPSPGLVELLDDDDDDDELKDPQRRKKGKRLSLDFKDFPLDRGGKKNIRITNGDVAIKIWGPSVGGLTLTTGGSTSSSGENDSPVDSPASWKVNQEPSSNEEKSRSENRASRRGDRVKSQNPQKKFMLPWQKRTDTALPRQEKAKVAMRDTAGSSSVGGIDLENLVLGAMNPQHAIPPPPPIVREKELHFRQTQSDNNLHKNGDIQPAMSSLSYLSGELPNDKFGDKKFKTVKNDEEKGFEVYLEGSSSSSRYNSNRLRERAALSEKLLSKRKEILSIQQDLEACSLLLGKCRDTGLLEKPALPAIAEQRRNDRHPEDEVNHAIIRE